MRFLLLAALLLASPVSAQTQRYLLSGHVTTTNIQDPILAPHTHVGAAVGGYVDFNPLIPDNIQTRTLTLTINGDTWINTRYDWTGLPSSGTTSLVGEAPFGGGPGGVTNSIIGIGVTNGTGAFGISSFGHVAQGSPFAFIGGDITLSPAPEPGGLALAVPCLLPGVWWWRRRYVSAVTRT